MAAAQAHPAKKFYLCGTSFLILGLIFMIIAIIVPAWSRIPGAYITDSGVLSYMDYADTAVTAETTIYFGHWKWCIYYGDDNNTYTCSNSGGYLGAGAPSYGDLKCKGHLFASRILGVLAAAFTLAALIAAVLTFLKVNQWNPFAYWAKPSGPGAGAVVVTILALGLTASSWATWIVLAEQSCRTGTMPFNPLQGYSVSFIVAVFSTAFILFALIGLLLGYLNLGKVPHAPLPQEEVIEVYEEAPVSYAPPVSYAVTDPNYGAPNVMYNAPAY